MAILPSHSLMAKDAALHLGNRLDAPATFPLLTQDGSSLVMTADRSRA